MELDVIGDDAGTEVGNYFVSNYPPFSVWSPEHVPAAVSTLDSAPANGVRTPLGLYLHIPFCRKRCKFCYYRVYTDKNARDVDAYVDALAREVALYAHRERFKQREFDFVYFGGGTPSFLSSDQLRRLIERINEHWRWDAAREVTFECEPGTLRKSKLETIKAIGTTRLSLGIEHFDDDVLEINGRAHRSREVFRSYEWAREVGFDQLNIDLMAGLVGDTEKKWKGAVAQALALDPDSVTIYQMELPFNSVIAREMQAGAEPPPMADWAAKRAWIAHAFEEFERAGYVVSGSYTLIKPSDESRFIYRDSLWHGADMVGTGVASFSQVGGVHFQNHDQWDDYVGALQRGELPLSRAWPMTAHQRLIREMILQLKLLRIDAGYFREKFGVNIFEEFAEGFGSLVRDGFAEIDGDEARLTRAGLLHVDGLLPRFFEPQHRNIRTT